MKHSQSPITAEHGSMMPSNMINMSGSRHSYFIKFSVPDTMTDARLWLRPAAAIVRCC
jgi:hypothetical protein